jgi:hypothetical protein
MRSSENTFNIHLRNVQKCSTLRKERGIHITYGKYKISVLFLAFRCSAVLGNYLVWVLSKLTALEVNVP